MFMTRFTPNNSVDAYGVRAENLGDAMPGVEFCTVEPQMPCDGNISNQDSFNGARSRHAGGVLCCLGDGSVQLIDNSILMLGIDQNYKEIVIGGAIVLAVVVDQTKQRVMK